MRLELLSNIHLQTVEGHDEISREFRLRTFLHVFLGCPKNSDSDEEPDSEVAQKFLMFVQKLNACANHLEQVIIIVEYSCGLSS